MKREKLFIFHCFSFLLSFVGPTGKKAYYTRRNCGYSGKTRAFPNIYRMRCPQGVPEDTKNSRSGAQLTRRDFGREANQPV